MRDNYAYYSDRGAKTRALNLLRLPFRWPPLERWLARRTQGAMPGSGLARLVPHEYMYPKGSWRRAERDGFKWRLDLSDAVDHYLYFGFVEPGFEHLLQRVRDDSRVIDVGANIGMLTLPFARAAVHGRVVSFEPDPSDRARLVEHLALNAITNVHIMSQGLGSEEQMHRLYKVVGTNSGMNRIVLDDPQSERFSFTEIHVARLDDLWPQLGLDRIDLIKIDVEGFELEVLKGAEETLRKFHPTLYIELDDDNLRENGSSADQLMNFLRDRGYVLEQGSASGPLPYDLTHCHLDVIFTRAH